jgi:2-methylcitrate dehydratase PrpD
MTSRLNTPQPKAIAMPSSTSTKTPIVSGLTRAGKPSAVSAQLCAFVRDATWDDIPHAVRHELKRALLNYFAVALAGCGDRTLDIAVRTYSRFSAGTAATLIGRAERLDMLNAAAINAMSANVYDFDDTHTPTIIHPTSPVASALLALSEETSMTGKDFMLAMLLGIDVACRAGVAVSPFHYDKGWHITSTCGVLGAAVAAGKILTLSEAQLRWALGTAAAQAGGLVETLGTMSKSVSVGNAARNGILAALLAQEDFSGPDQPLEGVHAFLQVFGDGPDFEAVTHGLGSTWEISRLAYKPYPCGVVLNPVLDACLALFKRIDAARAAQITAIELTGAPLLRQRTDRPNIRTGRESQVSAQHAVPVALLRGKADLNAFSDGAIDDGSVRALGRLVQFRDDDSYSVDSAKVVLRFADETSEEEYVAIARGAIDRPLSDTELETKLKDLCAYGRSGCNPEPLIDAIWSLENMDDAAMLARMATATNQPPS